MSATPWYAREMDETPWYARPSQFVVNLLDELGGVGGAADARQGTDPAAAPTEAPVSESAQQLATSAGITERQAAGMEDWLRDQGVVLGDAEDELDIIGGVWGEPFPFGPDGPRRYASNPYYEGDDVRLLQDMPEEELIRLQQQLMTLGLASSIVPGFVDDRTANGFRQILSMANRAGDTWRATVHRAVRLRDEAGLDDADRPGFVEPVRLEPDRARLRRDVMGYAEQRLGRQLSDDEAEHLAGALADIERGDFDRLVAAQRSAHQAGVAAADTGEDQTPAAQAEHGSEVVAARFEDLFNERYGNELDMVGRVDAGREVSRLIMGGTGMASQMTGGV